MDPIANNAEQKSLALTVMAIWDDCPDNGEFNDTQTQNLCHAAYRLAELIHAMEEWKRSRGF